MVADRAFSEFHNLADLPRRLAFRGPAQDFQFARREIGRDRLEAFRDPAKTFKGLLNGVLEQDADLKAEKKADFKTVTEKAPNSSEISDLEFAIMAVKHLKSNGIALVKNKQLIGMGCGQTSRVDALQQAIKKSKEFGFDLKGAVMASDAFFPFPDCVDISHSVGITAISQPGGSIKDQDSINAANKNGQAMVTTGTRHFLH